MSLSQPPTWLLLTVRENEPNIKYLLWRAKIKVASVIICAVHLIKNMQIRYCIRLSNLDKNDIDQLFCRLSFYNWIIILFFIFKSIIISGLIRLLIVGSNRVAGLTYNNLLAIYLFVSIILFLFLFKRIITSAALV